MVFLFVYSKPETVEPVWMRDGLPSARAIKSGAWPKMYRPPPSLQKLLLTIRRPLTSSKFRFMKPPPPVAECVIMGYPVLAGGFQSLNSRRSPPNSRWKLLDGSNASLVMKSGETLGTVRVVVPLFNWPPG